MQPPRKPSDHVRLAQAFRIPPTKRRTAIAITSTFTALGALGVTMAFVPAAGLLLGVSALELTDRRAIRRGLRELEGWGFPHDGYRAWLLAEEPTFEIELLRPADLDVISAAAAAIDPAIRVSGIGGLGFRVVTPRIALPGKRTNDPPIHLGDRRLLGELYERILSPLHADVGVVAMRMGDRGTLAPVASAHDDANHDPHADAFRDPHVAAPPALQALVTQGPSALQLGDVDRRDHQQERSLYAARMNPAGAGTVIGIALAGAVAAGQLGPIGVALGAIGGFVGGIVAVVGKNRRNISSLKRLVAWPRFGVEGYEDWLTNGRPLFDIHLVGPPDRSWVEDKLAAIEAFSGEANATVRWVLEVTWLGDTIARVETRPTLIKPSSNKIPPFYGGSHDLFQRCLTEVLVPLHERFGISVVRMGGQIHRRSP